MGALRSLPAFLALVWQTSRSLTLWSLLLRAVRALLPVATLYVGKLIIDECPILQAAHRHQPFVVLLALSSACIVSDLLGRAWA